MIMLSLSRYGCPREKMITGISLFVNIRPGLFDGFTVLCYAGERKML
jgi:hypothetical protein